MGYIISASMDCKKKNTIRIKDFCPIGDGFLESDDGFFDIEKVTIFIGEQASGKSSVAKLISSFLWAEKACYEKRRDSNKQF